MSFIDNEKIVGWAFFIIGILMIISAIVQIYDATTMDGGLGDHLGYLVAAIGAVLAAIIYFKFGNSVRTGSLSGKLKILGNYVRVVGVTSIVIGIFGAIGGIMSDISFWDNVLEIILGLIVVWASGQLLDGKKTLADKVLWILLLVIFVILFIAQLIDMGGDALDIVVAVCNVIVYLFMILYLVDEDVRKKLGM